MINAGVERLFFPTKYYLRSSISRLVMPETTIGGGDEGVSECKVHHTNKERCRAAFGHLQHPLQPFLLPQCMSSLQVCVASGRVVQHTSQPPSAFLLQPHSLGDGNSIICLLDMLDERSLCRGKSINCSAFLSEQLLSCFIDTKLTSYLYGHIAQIAPGAPNGL